MNSYIYLSELHPLDQLSPIKLGVITMSSKLCRADVPFREALRYVNVNSFGSNLCVLVARNYVEVDIYGRNLPLPGVK